MPEKRAKVPRIPVIWRTAISLCGWVAKFSISTSPKAACEGSATYYFSVGGFASGVGAGASGSGVGVVPRSSGAARAVAGRELGALERTTSSPLLPAALPAPGFAANFGGS
jgi:hypothetical protein